MATYLERYLNGEYEQVCNELLQMGSAVRQEPIFSDAIAVLREIMSRCKANIQTLVNRLNELGYKFNHTPFIIAHQEDIEELKAFEHEFGQLPMSFEIWYETINTVDFTGFHPKLSFYYKLTEVTENEIYDPDEEVTEFYSDPIAVDNLQKVGVGHLHDEKEKVSGKNFFFAFADDPYHKANVGGGEAYEIHFPDSSFDSLIVEHPENFTFIQYLRNCFTWGGFPGFQYELEFAKKAKEELQFLAEGLLPI